MIIIPAVDIRHGKCVRLSQGRADAQTVYGDDPSAMAKKWQDAGASLIHVVDLDGAFEKEPKNADAVKKILETVTVPIQLGGGIRNLETARMWLEMGVRRVIIGTVAVRDPDLVAGLAREYPDRVIVGIDARDGKVAVEGWTETTELTDVQLAAKFAGLPLAAFNFTDIARDGMHTGVNLEATRRFAQATSIPVVASGGISTIDNVKALLPLEADGVVGVITGRALYAGTLDLVEAIEVAGS